MQQSFNFCFHVPTEIVFGNGQFNTIGERAKGLGRKAMLVTYPDFPYTEKALNLLTAAGLEPILFDQVEENPTHTMIDAGGALVRQEGYDVIIGLGGGSAMDAAKGISTAGKLNFPIWEVTEGRDVVEDILPVLVVPTTSGTGSETTPYAVISNRSLKRKEGVFSKSFYPRLALCDPELTLSLPASITAVTGLDALSHAIEAYHSRLASPLTDLIVAEAIRLIGENLRTAVWQGNNIAAREKMMYASMLAGAAIGHTDTTICHVIGEAIGAVYNTAHGSSVSLTMPAVMEYNYVACIDKYAHIAEMLGKNIVGMSKREAAKSAGSAVRDLIRDVKVPQSLSEIGVNDLEEVMKLVLRPGLTDPNPRELGEKEFLRIIKGSMTPALTYFDN